MSDYIKKVKENNKQFKIINITNCKIWNNKILYKDELDDLIRLLELSRYIHVITYKDLENDEIENVKIGKIKKPIYKG